MLSYVSYLLRLVGTELLFKNQIIFRSCSFYLQMFKQREKNWQEYCNLQEVFCASNAHYIKRNKILELILEDVSLKN